MRRGLIALLGALILVTGVALATPVPVLSVKDGDREFLGLLRDGEKLVYSYRQSIYEVTVYEEFERNGDRLDFLKVVSSDIRSIEYFRWDSAITQEGQNWVAEPPPTDVTELVIRIAPAGEQRLRSGGWSIFLAPLFGDGVVQVRVERPAILPALIRGLSW